MPPVPTFNTPAHVTGVQCAGMCSLQFRGADSFPLGLQVPAEKVFGVGLESRGSRYLLRRYLEP